MLTANVEKINIFNYEEFLQINKKNGSVVT